MTKLTVLKLRTVLQAMLLGSWKHKTYTHSKKEKKKWKKSKENTNHSLGGKNVFTTHITKKG